MRDAALFPLAHCYGYTPAEIDAMSFRDFVVLSAVADEWLKADARRPRL